LMGQLVSFHKVKLTNSFSNLSAEKVRFRWCLFQRKGV